MKTHCPGPRQGAEDPFTRTSVCEGSCPAGFPLIESGRREETMGARQAQVQPALLHTSCVTLDEPLGFPEPASSETWRAWPGMWIQ